MGFKSFLRDNDEFGHPVQLNFKGQGGTAKTPFGGFISMFYKITMLTYFVIRLRIMINYENNSVGQSTGIMEVED
jgi:hypothetical protein